MNELINYASLKLKLGEIEKIFYSSYIKKLRICQYLIQQRLTAVRKNPKPTEIKISQDYLAHAKIEKATSKDFKDYLDHYQPENLTLDHILK